MRNLVRLTFIVSICGATSNCTPVTPLPGYGGSGTTSEVINYNAQVQQNANDIANNSGLSSDAALVWSENGFAPNSTNRWISVGVTDPNVALQWIKIAGYKPAPSHSAGFDADFYTPDTIDFVEPMLRDGLTPQQIQPFSNFLTNNNDSLSGQDIVNAWSYYQKGLSINQAIYFSSKNISYDQISNFVAAKAAYDQQKSSINQQCTGNISSNAITAMSPFSIQGQCYDLETTYVTQWVDQNSALVENSTLFLDFPNGQQQTNGVNESIVEGESPYSYNDASGAQLTIPRALVLMYIQPNLEGPPPPTN